MNRIPEKSLMLEFLEENSHKNIDRIESITIQNWDDDNGFIGENYIVNCVLKVPDCTIPINNLCARKETKCLVKIQQFKIWKNSKESIIWL